MTATQLDGSTDGFGATSEFSGSSAGNLSDFSVEKTITNPTQIAHGANADFHIVLTNNGWSDADLSAFANIGLDQPLLYDMVPVDLGVPANIVADGPFPDSKIITVNNPDIICLYGPAPYASLFGLTQDQTIGIVACWFVGEGTTFSSGSTIAIDLSFEVLPESDLKFTNYVIATPPVTDPDAAEMGNAFNSGDALAYFQQNQINNFASVTFPLPTPPQPNTSSGTTNQLPATGQNMYIVVLYMSILTCFSFTMAYLLKRRNTSVRM